MYMYQKIHTGNLHLLALKKLRYNISGIDGSIFCTGATIWMLVIARELIDTDDSLCKISQHWHYKHPMRMNILMITYKHLTLGKILGKLCIFPKMLPFAHFEEKNGNILGENTKKSHAFSQCRPPQKRIVSAFWQFQD